MLKTKSFIYILLAGIVLLGICIYIVFFMPFSSLKDTETIRLNSPDNKLDAVKVERDAGAMTTAQHLIYIVPAGHNPNPKDIPVFKAKRVFDLALSWKDDQTLMIQYSKADISHFQNYIYSSQEDQEGETRIIEQQVK